MHVHKVPLLFHKQAYLGLFIIICHVLIDYDNIEDPAFFFYCRFSLDYCFTKDDFATYAGTDF